MNKTLKNATVKEVIAILEQMNPNAILCTRELETEKGDFVSNFYTVESCKELNTTYFDDDGNEIKGDIVLIF